MQHTRCYSASKQRESRHRLPLALLTTLIAYYTSFCFVFEADVVQDDFDAYFPANFLSPATQFQVVLFAVLGAVISLVLFGVARLLAPCLNLRGKHVAQPAQNRASRPPFVSVSYAGFLRQNIVHVIGYSVVLFLCWCAVSLAYFPGTSMNDQLVILNDPAAQSAIHPVLYCYVFYMFVTFGYDVLGSANTGMYLYILLQMLVCALVVASVVMWLRWRGVRSVFVWVVLALFALSPTVHNYVMCAIKDTPFSFFMLLFIPFMFEYAMQREGFWRKKSHVAYFAIIAFVISATRNNGLYIMVVLVFIFAVGALYRRDVTFYSIGALIALAVAFLPGFIGSQVVDVQSSVKESLSVPLQQISAVYASGEDVSDDLTQTFDQFFDVDAAVEVYRPNCADPIKLDILIMHEDYLQKHTADFLLAWWSLGCQYPDIYLRAWLSCTFQIWAPLAYNGNDGQSYFYTISSNEIDSFFVYDEQIIYYRDIMDAFGLSNQSLYPGDVTEAIDFYEHLLNVYVSVGLLFMLVLYITLLLSYRKVSLRCALVILPSFLLWGTLMLAVPMAAALRYGFIYLLEIPILLCMFDINTSRIERQQDAHLNSVFWNSGKEIILPRGDIC